MNTSTLMTRDVAVVSPTVPISRAARTMEVMRIRHLPVVEGGRLVGIVSDRDLMKRTPNANPSCGDVMTAAPVTCLASASVSHVARLMLEHKIDSIPIVNYSGTLAGLVTSTDLLSLLVDEEHAHALPFEFRLQMANSDGDPLFA